MLPVRTCRAPLLASVVGNDVPVSGASPKSYVSGASDAPKLRDKGTVSLKLTNPSPSPSPLRKLLPDWPKLRDSGTVSLKLTMASPSRSPARTWNSNAECLSQRSADGRVDLRADQLGRIAAIREQQAGQVPGDHW